MHNDFSPGSFSFPFFLTFPSRYLLLVITFLSAGQRFILTVQKTTNFAPVVEHVFSSNSVSI